MNSETSSSFWKSFESLPQHIQIKARECYKLWKNDNHHSTLRYKQVHPVKGIFSVRIGLDSGIRRERRKHYDLVLDWFSRRL